MARLPSAQQDLRSAILFDPASVRSLGPEASRRRHASCGDPTSHHEMMQMVVLWTELA